MNIYQKILLVFLAGINLLSFILMFLDKEKAKNSSQRISEKALFLWALFFGAFGVYSGMFAFRHKTQKWYFLVGMPLILIGNAYLISRLFLAFSDNIS